MFGFAGKLLRINLTSGDIKKEDIKEEEFKKFLGGRGLAAKILYQELSEKVDPLSPDNKLVIAPGALLGTPALAANKTLIASKSPLTGLWGDSVFGGSFGIELKKAGYDAIVVEGKSNQPIYLYINDQKVEIKDGQFLWGLETGPAQEAILKETGQAKVLTIGPAGENLVKYAAAISELHFVAGRTGMGCVMGAKNLKAIAVKGSGKINVAHRSELIKLTRQIIKEIKENPSCGTLTRYGTWNNLTPLQNFGILPTKNFQQGTIEGGERLESEAFNKAILTKRYTCPNCPIFCRPIVEMATPFKISGKYGGPQYETVAALGSLLLNTDPAVIAKAHELCNRYGLDSMSTGACIAWAMECWERGINLGRPLSWGDGDKILQLIEEITFRRSVGKLLADGLKAAVAQVGQGSEAWALQVKGLEMAMHDPRGKKGMGLSYATANRGGCHLQIIHEEALEPGGPFPELGLSKPMSRKQLAGKPYMVKITQDYFGTLNDSLGICKFPTNAWRPFTPGRMVDTLSLVTGWDISLADLLETGERIYNLCRLFNVREGVNRVDDVLPPRLSEPLPAGATAGEIITKEDLNKMLDEYYQLRGWDKRGIPLPETLQRLGLSF
ncbi:MAG: aldehyde ferredoxin oxidoreductase family protein [Thermodesulfobacteriota bacterium]